VSHFSQLSPALFEEVSELMRAVARELIVPRFRALERGEIEEKAPGELVTIADRESEQRLSEMLPKLLPGSRVVGEESVASRPELLHELDRGTVWLVDPLDGTSNFIAGTECFSVMVALLAEGEATAAFMLDPLTNLLTRAELGAGAYLESERLRTASDSPSSQTLRGAVLKKYMPSELREQVEQRVGRIGEILPGTHCAGAEYPAVVSGRQDFAAFWRTLPWDHAPGTLFLTEAGGVARRFDGAPYRPAEDRRGLLVARNPAVWESARRALFED
jgi:fructose-1,6-bisphosphatase/inositol monophosphatase family enzyme